MVKDSHVKMMKGLRIFPNPSKKMLLNKSQSTIDSLLGVCEGEREYSGLKERSLKNAGSESGAQAERSDPDWLRKNE